MKRMRPMTTPLDDNVSSRPAYVSPALLRPLREWDEVWKMRLAAELAQHAKREGKSDE
jgi:hypothetical protein